MKTNKINIIFNIVFGVMILTTSANAQDSTRYHNPEMRARKQTVMMKTELSLSPDQASKVESINMKYAAKMKEQREAMHKQMKSLREEKEKEISTVLTKEQIEKYNKLKAEQKSKRMHHQNECIKNKSNKK